MAKGTYNQKRTTEEIILEYDFLFKEKEIGFWEMMNRGPKLVERQKIKTIISYLEEVSNLKEFLNLKEENKILKEKVLNLKEENKILNIVDTRFEILDL